MSLVSLKRFSIIKKITKSKKPACDVKRQLRQLNAKSRCDYPWGEFHNKMPVGGGYSLIWAISLRTGSRLSLGRAGRAERPWEAAWRGGSESHSLCSRSHDALTPTRFARPIFFRPRWEPVRRLMSYIGLCCLKGYGIIAFGASSLQMKEKVLNNTLHYWES